MEVYKIPANYDGQKLKFDATVEDLRKIILDKNIFILKNAFPVELINQIKNKVFNWGNTTEPSNPQFEIGIKDFHRLDLNPAKAAFMRIMHCYSIHFWNEDEWGFGQF